MHFPININVFILTLDEIARESPMHVQSNPTFTRIMIEGGTPGRAELASFAAQGKPVHLIECDFEETDLSNLDMSGWRFEDCVLKRTNFTGATLEEAEFLSCRGAFINFTAARMVGSVLAKCDFNNGQFTGASVLQVSFIGCKLTGADFTRAHSTGVVFKETTLSAARLPGFSFRKDTLERVDFSMADLVKCDFRNAVFSGSSLRESNLSDARFEGADLRGADLGGLKLSDARMFKGATISRDQAGTLLSQLGLIVR